MLESEYHNLTDMIVCSRESKICMIHRCKKCPGLKELEQYLQNRVEEMRKDEESDDENEQGDEDNNGDDKEDDEFEIEFKQWTTTDRTELVHNALLVDEFIKELCEKLDKITSHSYIAKSQAKYLADLKDNLKENEAIVLGDFAENYQFLIQDEVQGYHWSKKYYLLHSIVIYDKFGTELKEKSLCVISEDIDHDVSFVYKVLEATITYLKSEVALDIQHIHYFSDGCAEQYKNCKHFMNLCHHKTDFSISCTWNFFAISHRKSPCDSIGGTVKRLTARASLQRPIKDQILSTKDMFEFCNLEINGIKFVHLTSKELDITRAKLKD